MLQVSAALEVLPLCQLKPFMKGVQMHKLVLSRRPFVWWLSRGFLAFQTRLIFLLATETSFIVTAETHETIPDSLRTLFLNGVDVSRFSVSRMNCGLLSSETIKPGIMSAGGDTESPAWNKPLINLSRLKVELEESVNSSPSAPRCSFLPSAAHHCGTKHDAYHHLSL